MLGDVDFTKDDVDTLYHNIISISAPPTSINTSQSMISPVGGL